MVDNARIESTTTTTSASAAASSATATVDAEAADGRLFALQPELLHMALLLLPPAALCSFACCCRAAEAASNEAARQRCAACGVDRKGAWAARQSWRVQLAGRRFGCPHLGPRCQIASSSAHRTRRAGSAASLFAAPTAVLSLCAPEERIVLMPGNRAQRRLVEARGDFRVCARCRSGGAEVAGSWHGTRDTRARVTLTGPHTRLHNLSFRSLRWRRGWSQNLWSMDYAEKVYAA